MPYGLADKDLQAITGVFAQYPAIEQAVLYGSRAKGNYRPNSDIDLTLKGQNLALPTLFQIENDLDDLLLPYKIDLSIFHKIDNPALVEHIERVGIVVFGDHRESFGHPV